MTKKIIACFHYLIRAVEKKWEQAAWVWFISIQSAQVEANGLGEDSAWMVSHI